MIKIRFQCDPKSNEEPITWVTKSTINSANAQSCIGLSFHKISPRLKDSMVKNSVPEESHK